MGISSPGTAAAKYKQRFVVNVRNQWMPVPVKDIACFSKEILNYIYLFNGEKYSVDITTLDEVEEVLDPGQFTGPTGSSSSILMRCRLLSPLKIQNSSSA